MSPKFPAKINNDQPYQIQEVGTIASAFRRTKQIFECLYLSCGEFGGKKGEGVFRGDGGL